MGKGLGIERTSRQRKGYDQGSVEVSSGRNGMAKEMEGKS